MSPSYFKADVAARGQDMASVLSVDTEADTQKTLSISYERHCSL